MRHQRRTHKTVSMFLTEQEALQLSLTGQADVRGVVVVVVKRHFVAELNSGLCVVTLEPNVEASTGK